MATKLGIYQEAIRLFGDARLDIITDDTESRYAMDDAWDGVVRYCMRAAAWRFAIDTFHMIETAPGIVALPGFAVAYNKPPNWLRTHQIFVLNGALERPVDAREFETHIYANHHGVILRFIGSENLDPDTALSPWPEHFAKYVAAYLAFQVADRLTNSAAAGVRMAQLVGSLSADAIAHDALPEDPWLRHQLDGSFQEGLLFVLKQGYWDFALKTVEFTAAPITMPPPTVPIIGYPYSYPQPDDMLRSHAFFVPAGDGREYPIDIKEDGNQWSTTQPYFAARYISSTLGTDPQAWEEPFLATLEAYLRLRDAPDQPAQTSRTTGQPIPPVANFVNALRSALEIDGTLEDQWYRHIRSGRFLRGCFAVAETGRWRFAIDTLRLEADAWIEQDDVIQGQLPANVYGAGEISPSYSAIFAKPADWLRTLNVYHAEWQGVAVVDSEVWPNRTPIDYRDERGNWHTNYRVIQVRYIRRAAIESWRWPQSYATAVMAWCEFDEVRQDPKQVAAAAGKQRIYEDLVDKSAKSDDSQEFPPYRTVGRIVRGRFGRMHSRGAQNFTRF